MGRAAPELGPGCSAAPPSRLAAPPAEDRAGRDGRSSVGPLFSRYRRRDLHNAMVQSFEEA